MAKFLNQIQGGRWDNLLRRQFATKEMTIAPSLAPEVVPYAVVQNWVPEMYKLRNENLCMGFVNQAAVAGQASQAQLFNPINSQFQLIIEKFTVRTPVAVVVDLRWSVLNSPLAGTQAVTGFRDGRAGIQPVAVGQTVGQLISLTNAVPFGGNAFGRFGALANSQITEEIEFIIGPGQGILFALVSANQSLQLTVRWRERFVENGELTA